MAHVLWCGHSAYLAGKHAYQCATEYFFFVRSKKFKIQLLMVMNIVIFFEDELNQPHQFDAKFHREDKN